MCVEVRCPCHARDEGDIHIKRKKTPTVVVPLHRTHPLQLSSSHQERQTDQPTNQITTPHPLPPHLLQSRNPPPFKAKMVNAYTPLHTSLAGPGDRRPTAHQIITDNAMTGQLANHNVLVTGASSGIGIPTVLALAETGAKVYATVRNIPKGRDALAPALAAGRVELIEMDQTSLASVRRAAADVLQRAQGKLSLLVCNAGVMETPYGLTADGFETQFAVNHVAHFLLFALLRDALLAASAPAFHSRVVMVSSMGHKWGQVNFGDYNFSAVTPDSDAEGSFTPRKGYGQSKTANIYMANQIERLYGAKGLHGLSLHPGGIMTGLQVHVDEERKKEWGANEKVMAYLKSGEQGAATSVFAAVAKQLEGRGGLYLEDCDIALPEAETEAMGIKGAIGYGEWAYNKEGEERLWNDSLKLVGAA